MSSRPFQSSLPSRLHCGLSPHRLGGDSKLDLRAGGTEVSRALGSLSDLVACLVCNKSGE